MRVSAELGVVKEPELSFGKDNGKPWIRIRGVFKDRLKDDVGNWTDGFGKAAENLYESVSVGDRIIVEGEAHYKEWDQNGIVRPDFSITATLLGVSTGMHPAKTPRTAGEMSKAPVEQKAQPDSAPF
jgi:single-stranded DNA-binding protein